MNLALTLASFRPEKTRREFQVRLLVPIPIYQFKCVELQKPETAKHAKGDLEAKSRLPQSTTPSA
jgi:hypothetical protein